MRYATIGGQAVIEGVMMRNGNDYKNSKKLHRKFNRLRVC